MKTSDYDYELPPHLVAAYPPERREESRMMVVHRAEGRFEHRRFRDLPEYLRAGDLLVLNNTKVIPARVFGRKAASGGKVELLMLEEVEPGVWEVLLHASRRPKIGATILFGEGLARATLLEDGERGRARVKIESERPWLEVLQDIGAPPLPPYIIGARKAAGRELAPGAAEPADRERYQTVYATRPGAVAAPTAGLHFTPEMFQTLEKAGVRRATVTLHVGLGTFRPVESETVEEHTMEAERYEVPTETAAAIEETRSSGGRIVGVGSTTVRTLETVATEHGGHIVPASGRSSIFIYPPYHFKAIDVMLTNFHLPRSTLIMMISALAGRDLVMKAYEEAVREEYRFYSYGDCMLIL